MKSSRKINQAHLAEVVGIHFDTLQRWRKKGGMPYKQCPTSRQIIFDEAEVYKWLIEYKPRYLRYFEQAFEKLRSK